MPQLIATADPNFSELVQEELNKSPITVEATSELAPGVLLVTSANTFWELAEAWRMQPPIFIRHICPVEMVVPLNGSANDVGKLSSYINSNLLEMVDPSLPFSVQTRIFQDSALAAIEPLPFKPFDINKPISEALQTATGAPLDVRNPAQILSIVIAETPKHAPALPTPHSSTPYSAFIGISPAIYNLSNWAGGMRRFAREPEQVSRSEFKLLEALDVFDIDLPPRGTALDLGAAPGGWTRILRTREQYVTAVDPGDLHPRIADDHNVRHLHMTAENYLHSEPDQFDLIVNDMRMDARDSARLMVKYARHLYRHGSAIVTLKLPERKRQQALDHSLNILRRVYTIGGARQLFHNRSEITVYLKLVA